LLPHAHVKTGLPHGGSRVEFRQVFFIPLHRNNERPSLDDSPGDSTQLDPISDRHLFGSSVNPLFIKRQSQRDPNVWVNLGDPRPAPASSVIQAADVGNSAGRN